MLQIVIMLVCASTSRSLRHSVPRLPSRAQVFLRCLSGSPSSSGEVHGRSVVVPSGLLAVYKPQNWTSSDVVGKIKFVLQRGAQERAGGRKCRIKVGHGGSLDPLAQGVLVLGIGEGTKLMGQYLQGAKEYRGTGLLGSEMDTQDCTGVVTETLDWSHVTLPALASALPTFRGEILQIPPMYSALKKDGKKLYELARAGVEVERESRPVTIYRLELTNRCPLTNATLSLPSFGLDVHCSGGTYVRTLISDIARSCGTRAHMTNLLRCKQGPFTLDECLREEQWTYDNIVASLERAAGKTGLTNPKNAIIFPT